MFKFSKWEFIALMAVVCFPFFFKMLASIDSDRGIIWFFIHQFYYAPLGIWVDEPFFTPDSEIMFHVNSAGRALGGIVYVVIFCIFRSLVMRFKKSKHGSLD